MTNTIAFLLAFLFAQTDVSPAPPRKQYPPQIPVVLPEPVAQKPGIDVPAASNTDGVQVVGILEVLKHNNVVLAATERAVLMSLKTDKRDIQGKPVLGADGNPVMVPLTEGMYVFKDQILGKFDDRELQSQKDIGICQLAVAKAEYNKKIEIEYAEWGVKVSEAEYKMLQTANRIHRGTISEIEVLKAALAWEQAKANLKLQEYTINEVKRQEVTVREKEIDSRTVLIELRKLVAPIDGIIVRLDKAEGEWLREGDEVLEIMQLNALRARCKVDAEHYTPDMVDGKPATVSMLMVNGKVEEFPGKVVFANPTVEPGNKFEVYIEVQNRPAGSSWVLQPGRSVSAVIHL
ncbi:MAG: HlyD family efflux transporter periplasmic adaptor subunit [Planctomycetaceae bacterium]|jgi:multidrug efflux pump subunit AcrA (membrane-fusion protein)|nr:HlyD family efflux transporter periplasmic adaptor subunit [Planctomycetaceae bacterium]